MSYIVKLNTLGSNIYYLDDRDGSKIEQEKADILRQILVLKEAEIMAYLNHSLNRCFGINYGYTRYVELVPNNMTEYYLVFIPREDNITFELVFSTSFVNNPTENRLELYSVCKTPSPYTNRFKVSYFLYNTILSYFRIGFTRVWLGVLFSNPNYERAVLSYLRAGFELKYVASMGGGEKSNYEGRIIVMEAYAGKRAFSSLDGTFTLGTDEEQQMITIAKNIKLVEYDALISSNILLKPSAWKLFLKQVVIKDRECGGIIRKKIITDDTVVIDKYSILMGCEGGEGQAEEQCTTTQVFPYEINFHTHPIICYNKVQGEYANLGPPSVSDFRVIFSQYLHGLRLFHMVAGLEGIYVVQVHPYWQYILDNSKISEECLLELDLLINSINDAYFPPGYFSDIGETLKYANNLMSPNLILKRYGEKKGITTIQTSFKDRCLLQGVNRNINLFICTFIQYPVKTEITGGHSMLEYIKMMKDQKKIFDQTSLNDRAVTIKKFLETGFVDIELPIPFYNLNPAMIDRINQII